MEPELTLLSPWIEPHSPEGLSLELRREVAPPHELHGKSIRAIAVVEDCDDVLFAVEDADSVRYAVVHLTWSRKPEPIPWPHTTFFDSLELWIERMKADHDNYTYGAQ
jgi:hypothetical protein